MRRLVRTLLIATTALTLLVIAPAAALASVPANCTFDTLSISSTPLQVAATMDCPGYAAGAVTIDDASLIGPATVHFYSGADFAWTKNVTVPTAGTYKLSVTATLNSDGGPVTGTSTCCSVKVYGADPTAPPAPVITPAPVAPGPVTTPRPGTPRPPTSASTDSPQPSGSPSAGPSDSPGAAANASPSAPPEPTGSPPATPDPTASPPASQAPAITGAPPAGGTDPMLILALVGLAALGLLALAGLFLLLLGKRRRRRQSAQPFDITQPAP